MYPFSCCHHGTFSLVFDRFFSCLLSCISCCLCFLGAQLFSEYRRSFLTTPGSNCSRKLDIWVLCRWCHLWEPPVCASCGLFLEVPFRIHIAFWRIDLVTLIRHHCSQSISGSRFSSFDCLFQHDQIQTVLGLCRPLSVKLIPLRTWIENSFDRCFRVALWRIFPTRSWPHQGFKSDRHLWLRLMIFEVTFLI